MYVFSDAAGSLPTFAPTALARMSATAISAQVRLGYMRTGGATREAALTMQ
jgi:hypothetical protein